MIEGLVDITSSLDDINPGDRVFAYEGRFYKVRIIIPQTPEDTPALGFDFIRISGSETDETGKTKLTATGAYRVSAGETHTFIPGAPVDIAATIQEYVVACIQKTHQAALAKDHFEAMVGLSPPAAP